MERSYHSDGAILLSFSDWDLAWLLGLQGAPYPYLAVRCYFVLQCMGQSSTMNCIDQNDNCALSGKH